MLQTHSTIKNIKITLVSIQRNNRNSNQHKQESKSKIQRNKLRITHFFFQKSRDGDGVWWCWESRMVARGTRVLGVVGGSQAALKTPRNSSNKQRGGLAMARERESSEM